MFNGPNYKLVSSYINNHVNERFDPSEEEFNRAIAQSVKFDRNGLRGDANQLRQELHGIISQSEYTGMNSEKKDDNPIILNENTPWNNHDQSYLNSCRAPVTNDGYYTDSHSYNSQNETHEQPVNAVLEKRFNNGYYRLDNHDGYYPDESQVESFRFSRYRENRWDQIWDVLKSAIITLIVVILFFIVIYFSFNHKRIDLSANTVGESDTVNTKPAPGLNV